MASMRPPLDFPRLMVLESSRLTLILIITGPATYEVADRLDTLAVPLVRLLLLRQALVEIYGDYLWAVSFGTPNKDGFVLPFPWT
ncbi:hypothetical protein HPB52_004223 [Rhipicephalus sanguineus]|uniref:Uncharacterized protein n=1 Tax=Rhipicephalus sanguineus TaxID=34632 RepID=A0A9D4PLG2_RHISA|nr:hypothetical protein HPB52_004223 [Rhipicephalus sanguineus]